MASPDLKLYRSDTLVEVGTLASPIDFGLCIAGQATDLAYELLLYNDKGGILDSVMARNLTLSILMMNLIQSWASDGNPTQSFTVSVIPLAIDSEEVTVDGVKWQRVDDFTSSGPSSTHYTLDYTTGVLTFGNGARGLIPPISDTIQIDAEPDLNTYGKELYNSLWIEMRSSGMIPTPSNNISVSLELATKISNDYVSVLNYPTVVSVVGVWANAGKTGTNYYTGGSFNADTGVITLGTPITAATPYVEYTYTIKDDAETEWSELGLLVTHDLINPLPKNNSKRIFLRITIPSTASTEGGAYLRMRLRVEYDS